MYTTPYVKYLIVCVYGEDSEHSIGDTSALR
jgi:hypothetical protein